MSEDRQHDPGLPISPAELVALVRRADDSQLAAGLAANRDVILAEVFRRMPERLDRERAGDLHAVVEWRILDRPGGGYDRFQVAIQHGTCTVNAQPPDEPRVALTIHPVDFIKLVSGNASGPELLLFGRLEISGDLVLAARLPALFRVPSADE